ncbi:MAG: hypothetical protein DBP02_19075 [gamma proteobacterium symbiont of Ctena orbiculata]|nr:MAG: hypothetical protein DBP02_19075 [gamma proteobacterium symbiont of Ctena orbiculata]
MQREHLAPLLWSDGNAVADRTTQYLLHWIFITLQVQVTVFFIAFQDSFSFQESGNPAVDRMHQFC